MRVVQFMRKPRPGLFSLERHFNDIRSHMPGDVQVDVCINQHPSRGIVGRLRDAVRAARRQGDVNHVTGDVHFLTYFMRRRRTILTVLDCVSLYRLKALRRGVFWLLWYWLPARRSSILVAISRSTRQQLLEQLRCHPAKVRVIPCTVSDEFQASLRTFNKMCPTILHVGTKPNKNLERHAAALEGIQCIMVIIGALSKEQRATLHEFGIQYENYTELSNAEMLSQYERCDLLLFASTYEGFGLPIVEAQAVGRPVITSRLWSMPEVAGDAAVLVDPFDILSIRDGVMRVINHADYRRQLIEKGLENVKRFRSEIIAARYAALYREVAES